MRVRALGLWIERSRRPALVATGAVTALLLSACGGSSGSDSPSSDSTPGTTTVNVGVIPIVDVAPIYLGVQQGFFKAEGLNLKLATAQGGAAIVPGVTSGQYQFGFSNTTSLLLAASKGLPVKALTAGVATTGSEGKDFGAVVVPADSPIHSAADLAGKRVAVNTLNNINTTTVNAAVRAGGGDPSGIDYVELAFPEITPAVAKGDVDAGQLVEPFLTIAKNQGMREVTSNYAATNPSLTIAMYFTSANYAKSHPDVVRRFTTAMNKSLAYADGNPDAVRTVLTSYLKIDPAVQKAITLPKWPTAISTDSVGKLADLAVQDKLITQKPDLSALLP